MDVAAQRTMDAAAPVTMPLQTTAAQGRSAILERETTFRRLLGISDAFAITLALAVAAGITGDGHLTWATLAVPPLFVLVSKSIGLYDRDQHLLHKTTLDEMPALFALATVSVLLLWVSADLLVDGELGRGQIAATWGTLFILLLALRSLARYTARGLSPVERCLFVGDAGSAEEFREKLATSHSVKAELVGWIPALRPEDYGDVEEDGNGRLPLAERIRALVVEREVHRIVLAPGPARSEALLDSVRQIKDGGLKVSVLPTASRLVSASTELDRLNGLTLLGVRRFEITHSSRFIKRAFDLVGSTLALVFLAPLLALTAIAIRLDSRGPMLFRQVRAGRHGEPFEMLKFRSMEEDADQRKDELRHLNEADGVFKITELPQLVNVVRGDMSLVGPRPLPLDEDRRIEGWHRRRLDLRPGITGPWQVLGSSRVPVREMVRLDYQYVADWSLWNDIRILLLTVPHIVRGRGL
jgi:lipopolysaccharide/colanic/teichoic acid biosynthesis glycosyltransferase